MTELSDNHHKLILKIIEASEVTADRITAKMLHEAFAELDQRKQMILTHRFGLDGQRNTLEVTGIKFGISRERTRQLQNLALRKLRRSKVLAGLGLAK